MRASFRVLLAAQLSLVAAAANDHPCNFTLDSLEFNLCPLFSGKNISVSIHEETPPTHTVHRYALSLGAPLKLNHTLPKWLQCPEGTWICLSVENTYPGPNSMPPRILQVVPVAGNQGLNPKAKMLVKKKADDLHEPLQVTLHGGLYNNRSQKASFEFHCDHGLEEPTLPTYFWQWNGTHTFSWRTKHACPRALPPGAPGPRPEEPDADPPATPPPDPDADVDDRESVARPGSISILVILFCISLSVLGLRILYPFLLRWGRYIALRLRFSTSTRNPRNKGFRPSALSLVQWAAEEDPEEYDVDDGFMHSFSDGEETPLTPNSRATFATSQYGTAG